MIAGTCWNNCSLIPRSSSRISNQNQTPAQASAASSIPNESFRWLLCRRRNCANLSQACRDKDTSIWGVILHVPFYVTTAISLAILSQNQLPTTNARHVPPSGEMRAIWDVVIPSATAGSDPKVSPLLRERRAPPETLISWQVRSIEG